MREQSPAISPKRARKYDFINPLVGHRLRILRHGKNISPSRTAKIIGKTIQQLDAIESGKESLTAESIYKLCVFFTIDAGYFFIDLAEINKNIPNREINTHQAKEVCRLFDSYLKLSNRETQKSLVLLVESVANSGR